MIRWWILVYTGKNFFQFLKIFPLLPTVTFVVLSRLTIGNTETRALRSLFLQRILSTNASQWSMFIQDETSSLFDCDMLLLPFHTEDQWSLFIVLGASKIKEYSTKRYTGIRPCIIHLDPFEWTKTCHHSSNIADKIRACLNCAWRKDNNEVDKLVMPFNKRSLPLCKPKGKYICYLYSN